MKAIKTVMFADNVTTVSPNETRGSKPTVFKKLTKLEKIQAEAQVKLAAIQAKIATVIGASTSFQQPIETNRARLKRNITRQIKNSLSQGIDKLVLIFRRYFPAKNQAENTLNSDAINSTNARINAQLALQQEGLEWSYTRVPFKKNPPSSN